MLTPFWQIFAITGMVLVALVYAVATTRNGYVSAIKEAAAGWQALAVQRGAELDTVRASIASLRSELKQSQNTCDALEKKYDELAKLNIDLQTERAALETRVKTAENQVTQLRERLKDFEGYRGEHPQLRVKAPEGTQRLARASKTPRRAEESE